MSSSDDMIEINNFTSTNKFQESENEPPRKRFKHLNLVCNLLEQEVNSASPVAPLWDGKNKLKNISTVGKSVEEMTLDPLDHWIQKD